MKEELLKRLDVLSAKLATTTEHLWKVLVGQARLEALISLLQVGIFGFLAVAGAWACIKLVRVVRKENNKPYTQQNDGVLIPAFIGAVLVGFVAIVGVIGSLSGLTEWITPMFNPEYWALKQILKGIGK